MATLSPLELNVFYAYWHWACIF